MKRWTLPAGWLSLAVIIALVSFRTALLPDVKGVMGWRAPYGLSLAAASTVFGLVYLRLAQPRQNRWFWLAGGGHLLLMTFGSGLLLFSWWLPRFAALIEGSDDLVPPFVWLTRMGFLGYGLTLVGLVAFLAALAATAAGRRGRVTRVD